MLLSNCDKKKLTFTNFLLTGDKFMPKVSLILYGDPEFYEFYEGKNSGLSIRSVYRPDKEFMVFFLLKSAFFSKY